MTSDFDIQLEKHEKKMKNATKKMFGFLESKKRTEIIVSAPAKGLCLEKVFYI